MVIEIEESFNGRGGVEVAEHSAKAGAKKTVQGPLSVAADPAQKARSKAPVVIASSGVFTLEKGKTYRIIGTKEFHILMYDAGLVPTPAITTSDILIPALEPVIIKCDLWNQVAVTSSSATIQMVELA